MATDDITETSRPCLCGKGTIDIRTSSPDHAWARPHQTKHSAQINCKLCDEQYLIYQASIGDYPTITYRADWNAKKEALQRYQAAEKAICQSEEANRLRLRIAAAIDKEVTMAARHRKLQELGLEYASYSSYRKDPYGGSKAAQSMSGHNIAKIGNTTELGGDDAQYFFTALQELYDLRKTEESNNLRIIEIG